jgi:hypothetical protein
MKRIILMAAMVVSAFCLPPSAFCFEGSINAVMTRGNQSDALLYTVGTNFLRVGMTATNRPDPVDIFDRDSGELTLLFPNNRSFVRLKPVTENSPAVPPPGMPAMPNMPPGVGPQSAPGLPAMPAMPMMPMPMMQKIELQDMGQKTNRLGFACEQYEIKQRGETMEIWATDQLFPFQAYVQNQPHRFGPRRIEQQWPELMKAKKLFPILAILKIDNGMERFRFEVQSVTPQKLTEDDAKLFQPPPGWFEIQPLPF